MNPTSPDSPQWPVAPLRYLARASRELAAEREPAHALSRLLEALREDLPVDRAGVFAFDRRANTIQLLRGIDGAGRHEPAGACVQLDEGPAPVKSVARREVPLFFSSEPPRAGQAAPASGALWALAAHAVVPVICAGQLLGLLAADSQPTGRPM